MGITSNNSNSGPALHFNPKGTTGLLWSSIALAVLTSFMQGLIVAIVSIAEDQNMWTFRFRIARYEHVWWTVVSTMLCISFVLIVLSFLSGNSSDSLGVLALSTATSIAVVRYAIPAWRNRFFIESRWLAWTGSSRTGVHSRFQGVCGDAKRWKDMAVATHSNPLPPAPSDKWGLSIFPPSGLWQDPTAILGSIGENVTSFPSLDGWPFGVCVYNDGYDGSGSVSLLWGEREGFCRRVSRGINSMPRSLLQSGPFTYDGYNGEGLCLAMGILGRNKGLRPRELVFDFNDNRKKERGITRDEPTLSVTTELENSSGFFPRPHKVMRSYYVKAMQDQFGFLNPEYVNAAAELALILLDCPPATLNKWLELTLEQQSMEVNQSMSNRPSYLYNDESLFGTNEELSTLYRASYVSMIISLNYFPRDGHRSDTRLHSGAAVRPDLICFALLWISRDLVNEGGDGAPEPAWWSQKWVGDRLNAEMTSLVGTRWRNAAAWLLGLHRWPQHLDNWPNWESVRYPQSV